MTIRTPRRRISPRTKRRYRAIKDFLRKALGTISQPDIKTTSSIAVSVSDLKNKIIGIEDQLHRVSRHCRDLSCLENNFRKKSLHQSLQDESINYPQISNENFKGIETNLIYKSSDRQYNRSDESNVLNSQSQDDKNNMTSNNKAHRLNLNYTKDFRIDNKNCNTHNFSERNRRAQSRFEPAASIYSTSSFHSLINTKNVHYPKICHSGYRKERRHRIEALNVKGHNSERNKRDPKLQDKTYDTQLRAHKIKHDRSTIGDDFIADIINKQYRPVKLFGRRDSDFSQFSAPICRDQEFNIQNRILEDCELCSCCFEGRKQRRRYVHASDLSDVKSICDARLYSSKKHRRYKYTRGCMDDYNNSTYYDVVPVKEKSSPKSRRKFAEDNMTGYHCKEVPPSPRSHRPRLNLKAQHHTDYVESSDYEKPRCRKNSPAPAHCRVRRNVEETDVSSECCQHRRPKENIRSNRLHKPTPIREEVGTTSSLQYPNFISEQNNLCNVDTTLNTQVTDSSADKTDKTLSEIKDILQSFLLEIKRESAHIRQSDVSSKSDDRVINEHQDNNKMSSMVPNSGHSFNCNMGQSSVPPFVPAFTNPCCYPMMPICPMNCLQNGYVMPNPSYTCNVCSKNSKPNCSEKDCCNNGYKPEDINDETQKLIKEIYKFVSQNSKSPRNTEHCSEQRNLKYDNCNVEKKILTSRSVGGSSKASRHDANVGTPNLKCHSKSCEAIGRRINSEAFNTTNASYSDTILEKLSLEATQSSTESDTSSENHHRKKKRSKFKKVLQSLKLFKKKHKRDVIAEETESESTIEVELKPKAASPYKQHIMNYAMHGQEYFHPPPVPQQHCCSPHLHEVPCGHGYDPRGGYVQPPNTYNHNRHFHSNVPHYTQHPAQPYPNCDPRCTHAPQPTPQVPLCLKEIEVKSIGTQSVRKMSILEKLTAKTQQPQQTFQQPPNIPISQPKEKPNFWKTLQEKAKQNNPDPMDFSLKTQKQLAQGDIKLRNAMLKKLFYKRNPFSPRNLIIKTLLGRDKSSFGDPPKMYRPRMFL